MKLPAVLKLARISALPSAWADQLGGMALVAFVASRAGFFRLEPAKIFWLLLMSAGVYLGGMALNDVLHVRKDRLIGKQRPLVTGELSVKQGWLVTGVLFAVGILAGFVAGCGEAVLALIALIFLYNHLASGRIVGVEVKHPPGWTVVGVAVIALCRAIHVSLPLMAHAGVGRFPRMLFERGAVFLFAGSVFVYFCLVTVVSLFEDRGGGRSALKFIQLFLLPAVFVLPLYLMTQPGRSPSVVIGLMLPMLVLAVLLMGLWRRLDAARAEPTPQKIGATVGAGIRGEALLMGGLALMLAPAQPWWGLAAVALYPGGRLLSRWVSPT